MSTFLVIVSITLIATVLITLFVAIALWLVGTPHSEPVKFIDEYKESNKELIKPPLPWWRRRIR
jgi:hypothetical protein